MAKRCEHHMLLGYCVVEGCPHEEQITRQHGASTARRQRVHRCANRLCRREGASVRIVRMNSVGRQYSFYICARCHSEGRYRAKDGCKLVSVSR